MAFKPFEKLSKKNALIAVGLTIAYLLWAYFFIGMRGDHVAMAAVGLIGYVWSPTTRGIILSLLFFFAYWLVYDSTRIYPNYLFNEVHIKDIYDLEKSWFGIQEAGQLLTPNEYWARHEHWFLDVISGLFYLCWIPVPIAYAIWLFFNDKKLLLEFSFSFFLVNVFGILIYYLYPAAPPWYVELHGFEKNFDIPGNEAALSNFDEFFGIKLFHNMYAKNANVFAAVPSLHSAFPVITLYFGWKKRLKVASAIFLIITLGIWFAAVYSRHHYIIDVFLGFSCAVLAIITFEILMKNGKIQRFLERYVKLIS